MARSASLQARVTIPPDRLAPIVGAMPLPAILESGPGFGPAGRWSLYAAEPRRLFRATGRVWGLRGPDGETHHEGDPLAALGRLLDELREDGEPAPGSESPPFRGGWIGHFGYDLAPLLERLPRRTGRDSQIPDVEFGLYDTFVAVDHRDGTVTLHVHDLVGSGSREVRERLERWLAILNSPAPPRSPSRVVGPLAGNFSRVEYLAAVGRALEYIRAGDIFQVNLSQRFEARGAVDPLDVYLRLKRRSPAPFSAFLKREDSAILSASPEWFTQTRGDRIVTRPIKGTRPRGATPEEDARLAAELRASAKDRAELTMIVDLERNDLGRVCRYGSVVVTEPPTIESYAQVHHLVATVEGRLRHEVGPIDAVRAMFPGGSITGAPKIRAMEIIDELEPTRRGLYTGSIGYFSRGGDSAFNIAIRTLLVEGDRVSYQVGGGIVADSEPELEYDETLHKGRAMREVLEDLGLES